MNGYPIPRLLTETPTLQNSFTTAFSSPITLISHSNIVFISGLITRSSQPSGGLIICNCSSVFRPVRTHYIWCQDGSGGVNGRVDIGSDGNLLFILGTLANTSQTLVISGSYSLI